MSPRCLLLLALPLATACTDGVTAGDPHLKETDADDDGDLRKRYHLVYRTPVYFLDGVYCPSLIESYWNQLGELNKLSDEIASSRLDSRRKAIEERWNRI